MCRPKGKGILVFLGMDGRIYRAKNPSSGPLDEKDVEILEWKGSPPRWEEIGGLEQAKLDFRSWPGWPFEKNGEVVIHKWIPIRGVFPRKFFVIGIEEKSCRVKGVWEDPYYYPLRFMNPMPSVGERGLCVRGGKNEEVEIIAVSPGGGVHRFRGNLGKKCVEWVEVDQGLKFGWVYRLKGAPWHCIEGPERYVSPILVSGNAYSVVEGLGAPEIFFPWPTRFFAGQDPLSFEVRVEAKNSHGFDRLAWYLLAAAQVEPSKAPVITKDGKTAVLPLAVRPLKPRKSGEGTFFASVDLRCVPKSAKGKIFWLQCLIAKPGEGVVAASQALGYCVLGAPVYDDEFSKKYGHIEFFMGIKPPIPVRPQYGPGAEAAMREWLKNQKDFVIFQNSAEGRKWLINCGFRKD